MFRFRNPDVSRSMEVIRWPNTRPGDHFPNFFSAATVSRARGSCVMRRRLNVLLKSIAVVLVCAMMAPPESLAAPRKSNPEAIHAKVVKRGIGNWVCIEEANGILLTGRIATIEEQAFGMQLENYPEITMIRYTDVVRLRSLGGSGKTMGIWIGVSTAAFVAVALIMHHEFEKNKPTLPTVPTPPVFP